MCTIDSDGVLYSTDEHANSILMLSTSGETIGWWGEYGSEPGQLHGPSGITLDADENLWIVNSQNHRVQKFTRRGEYENRRLVAIDAISLKATVQRIDVVVGPLLYTNGLSPRESFGHLRPGIDTLIGIRQIIQRFHGMLCRGDLNVQKKHRRE